MSKEGNALISNIKKRGYLYDDKNNCYEPPGSARFKELQLIGSTIPIKKNNRSQGFKTGLRLKTGWIDDTLNLKNKTGKYDPFIMLVRMDLDLDVWPEFYFTTERLYRFDYAIPTGVDGAPIKIAIECDGGTHMRGASGHSSPKGIARDMDKGTLAAVAGWKLIRRTPQQLCTAETIDLIRQALNV